MGKPMDVRLLPGERWWGGAVIDGLEMPMGDAPFECDLSDLRGNQAMPLLISNHGRSVWSEEPFHFRFAGGSLSAWSSQGLESPIILGQNGDDLRSAFLGAAAKYFPPTGTYPDPLLFRAPQYNTWIEMTYDPTQEKVREYAHNLLRAGFPPGVLMIDDNWMEANGTWRFHPSRFPHPLKMITELHELGFKLMLWTCPLVSPDTQNFRLLEQQGCLLRDAQGNTAIRKWWNGFSAVLDCTNPKTVAWYEGVLDELITAYGVDGFKLDAGDSAHYRADDQAFAPTHPPGHNIPFSRIGLKWPLNEYRASWKTAGWPLCQRLRDKEHEWRAPEGLGSLIPQALAQSLMGYAFTCPDMIGGGSWLKFVAPDFVVDEELFVRWTQCSALFPMMQFSLSPWRVLSKRGLEICLRMSALHVEMADTIESLARHAAKTGEPILRHLEYVFPHAGYDRVNDQFLLGDDILVAPVLRKDAISREIVFPPGRWIGDDGARVDGPCRREVPAPLERLPWYRRTAAKL
jgi:alpha-glucosidase (family GH31 glycosyl hydrolase)